jgi:hypothetical protein
VTVAFAGLLRDGPPGRPRGQAQHRRPQQPTPRGQQQPAELRRVHAGQERGQDQRGPLADAPEPRAGQIRARDALLDAHLRRLQPLFEFSRQLGHAVRADVAAAEHAERVHPARAVPERGDPHPADVPALAADAEPAAGAPARLPGRQHDESAGRDGRQLEQEGAESAPRDLARAEEGQDTELDEDTEGRAGAGRLSPIQVGTRSLLISWLLSELSRFNEDCQYQHCGYREHQTHFHCQRQDCGYSFCDKTRFVQHTARHERLDTLMGGDFQQYRANVACGRPDCAYTTNLGK